MSALDRVKNIADLKRVENWLDSIHEFDPAIRAEVIEQCKTDPDARRYFVMRCNEMRGVSMTGVLRI